MGIAIALAQKGEIELILAIALLIGAEIGTCVTSLIASIRVDTTARKVAYYHLIFNIVTLLLIIPCFDLFVDFVYFTSDKLPRQLANAQMIYNLWGAIWLLPVIHLSTSKLKKSSRF